MSNVNNENFLFEITDYKYISGISSLIPICLIVFIFGILQAFEITHIKENFFTRSSLLVTSSAGFLILIFMKIKTALKSNKRKIQFYTNKIIRTYDNTEISINKVEDIYLFSNLLFSLNTGTFSPKNRKSGMKKNIILRILLIIGMFLIFVPLNTIPLVIINLFVYKRPIITSFITPFNWNDDRAICIHYPLPNKEEQKKVKEYFKKYLNTDINELRKNYF